MAKEQPVDTKIGISQKYMRIKDIMNRYGYSRGHVSNLVKDGALPPPMVLNNVKLWPAEVIEAIDRQRDKEYYQQLREQGFRVPDDLRLSK
jgi:predicted DNA-binding transcriptional regulator AlpA